MSVTGASLRELLIEFEQHAASLYSSRRYELGGTNYGKDAVMAVDFVRRSLTTDDLRDRDGCIAAVRAIKAGFELRHADPEGVGAGVIEDLIRRLVDQGGA